MARENEMVPAAKATEVLQTGLQFADPTVALFTGLRNHMIGLTGDADRDLDRIEMHPDPGGGAVYLGYAGTVRRLLGAIRPSALDAELVLITTKGQLQADPGLFGQSGPDIGNAILVARLLHVAIFYLRASGCRVLANHPYDNRVRQIYTAMGFEQGERLPLDDLPRLTTAFQYIAHAYSHASLAVPISLAHPPPPV